jgi:outer membrane receptor protein involved in Fe transport
MNSDADSPFRLSPDDPGRSGATAVARLRLSGSALVLILASSLALPGEGRAASDHFTFKIPAKPRSEALIDLGVQARVTLGGVSACSGRSPAVVGTLTLRQALGAVTAGAPCRFEVLDNATVSILPAPPAPAPRVAPPPRPALTPVSEPAKAIESVIVTATKRPTRLGAAPGGVSVVGAERLEDTGAIDTTSISQQAAGFITTNLGAARNKIMLRGLSDGTFTGRTQQTVGTYLDNIPLTYNAPDPDLRLIDVDRVEVLRGPQGALYGGGSLSGVYRIVSRKPVLNEWSGMALVGGAATESGSPSSRLEGVVNLPLVTDRAALRLTAYDDIDGGYVDDVNLRLSNVDRTTRTGGRAVRRAGRQLVGRRVRRSPGSARHGQPVHDPEPGRPETRQPGSRDPRQRLATDRRDGHGNGGLGPLRVVDRLCPPPFRQPVRRDRGPQRGGRDGNRGRPVRRGQQGPDPGRGRRVDVAR